MRLTMRVFLFCLCSMWLTAFEPVAHAASVYDVLDSCIAGNAIDMPCMKKHRERFEKYVIKERDDNDQKLRLAQDLVAYYQRSGEPATDQSRIVTAKFFALRRASEIEVEVYVSHRHECAEGPGCEYGKYLDTTTDDVLREERIRVKQYLTSLDATLYEPEIKYLESSLKPKSDGTGFWNQALKTINDSGVIEAAGRATSH